MPSMDTSESFSTTTYPDNTHMVPIKHISCSVSLNLNEQLDVIDVTTEHEAETSKCYLPKIIQLRSVLEVKSMSFRVKRTLV